MSDNRRTFPWGFLLLLLLAFLLWAGSAWAIIALIPGKPDEPFGTRGQFGDMFGAVNSFFTSVAMAAAIYTIYLQYRELQAQRIEQAAAELARKTQMDLYSAQLAALQEQVAIQRARDLFESTRRLQWKNSSQSGMVSTFYFRNCGGPFTIKSVKVDKGAVGSWVPKYEIQPDQDGSISFTNLPPYPSKAHFWVDFKSRTDADGRFGFHVSSDKLPEADDVTSIA